MKKFLFLFFYFFLFLVGCSSPKPNDQEILTKFAESIIFPNETINDLDFKTSFEYNGHTINAEWISYEEDFLTNEGIIFRSYDDINVSFYVLLNLNNAYIEKHFDITILAFTDDEIAENIFNQIILPKEIKTDIDLKKYIKFNEKNYKISWESSDEKILSNSGEVFYHTEDKNIFLTASIISNNTTYSHKYDILIQAFDTTDMLNYLNSINFPDKINESLNLPESIEINSINYNIIWESSDETILDNNGNIGLCYNDTIINLKATISIDNVSLSKDFKIYVEKMNKEQLISLIKNKILLPNVISGDVFLPTVLEDNISGTWISSNDSIISNKGIINNSISMPTDVTLTFTTNIGGEIMTIDYNTIIQPLNHFIMVNTFNGDKENLIINSEGKLLLDDNKLQGTYYSNEISTHDFQELVPTWCSISSKESTCELQISVKVNGIYSEYISYKPWGLGLKNSLNSQNNNLVKLVEDEMKILNNKSANGIKFKLILKRDTISSPSPIVSLITFALNSTNYIYEFDNTLLKNSVRYDVPKLYQHDVPSIGNSICSPTSCTMLMKYKGYNFFNMGYNYEHEYFARTVYDNYNNIFGNWVYNCVTMSAFGERAYVKRFFNTNEFLYSLQEVGPMAASIKGTVYYYNMSTNTNGQYTTGGHLLVVTGYEITDNETFIYINDPNVRGVSIRLTLNNFLNVWRNVSYIIE